MRAFVYLALLAALSVVVVSYRTIEGRSMGYAQPTVDGNTKNIMMEMKRRQEKMAEEEAEEVVEPEEPMPDERCVDVGQFLKIPGDSCSFLVCDYGNEPWRDRYGNVKLFTVKMPCAPGTYVKGQPHHRDPCTGRHSMMCFPKKQPETLEEAMMQQDADKVMLTKMVDEEMEAVKGMTYEQVLKTVRNMGNLLQTQMYTVLELTPESSNDMLDEMVDIKKNVEELSGKADHVGYGKETMETTEMKDMCIKMMKVMKKLVQMKAKLKAGIKAEMKAMRVKQAKMAALPTSYGITQQNNVVMTQPRQSSSGQSPQGFTARVIVVPTEVASSMYKPVEMAPKMNQMEPEMEPNMQPVMQPMIEQEIDPEIEPDVKPSNMPEIEPEMKPDSELWIMPEVPVIEPEIEPEIEPAMKPEIEQETEMMPEYQGYALASGRSTNKRQVKKVMKMMNEMIDLMQNGFSVPQMMKEMRRRMGSGSMGMSGYDEVV